MPRMNESSIDFSNWGIEELVTAIGTLMRDMRGSWGEGTSYGYRMRETIAMLTAVKVLHESQDPKEKFLQILDGKQAALFAAIDNDILITKNELDEPFDGRAFRGCVFYEQYMDGGKTERVRQFLCATMVYPEYSWAADGTENDDE